MTAERSGGSELDVQQRMADHALHDVTPSSYASDLIGNFGRYVFQPTGFEGIFRARSEGVDPVNLRMREPGVVSKLDVGMTKILYFGLSQLWT